MILQRFRALRKSILFRLSALFALLLAVTSVTGILVLRTIVKRDLEATTRRELLSAAGNLDVDFAQARQEVALYAHLMARSAGEASGFQGTSAIEVELLERARNRKIEIDVIREDGAPKAYGDLLRRAFAGMPTVDYILTPTSPARLSVVAAVPVGVSPGRRVVVASMPVDREYLRQEKKALGGEVSIFARDEMIGTTSVCTSCIACIRDVLLDPSSWRVIEAGRPIYFLYDCKPEPQAVLATPVRAFDGRTAALVLSRSRGGETLALYHTMLVIVVGTVAFALAVSVIFGFLVRRALLPLKQLTRLSGEISEGRYGETIPVEGDDEVADLAVAFNRMSVSLDGAVREISDWNRTLEARVAEKTKELEKMQRGMVEIEKLAAIGQLAAGVAHELNNPLGGIMGYAELAIELFRDKPREQLSQADLDRILSYFRNIDGLSQRCRAIILDMLKFARSHDEEISDYSVNDLIRRTLGFVEKQLQNGNVSIELSLAEPLPALRGNAIQIQQVFTNLVLNAAQAMPDGGVLAVRTFREGDAVAASVTDSGKGIPSEIRSRIFDPFFTTRPVGEGTGLGLSVGYGIVRRHGGEIRVESEMGQGSTFTVVLPVPPAA